MSRASTSGRETLTDMSSREEVPAVLFSRSLLVLCCSTLTVLRALQATHDSRLLAAHSHEQEAVPVMPLCSRPHMTRSTAALVCAATATLHPRRGPSLQAWPRRKCMAATSSMLLPVPKGPCTTHSGHALCTAAVERLTFSQVRP